MHTRYLFLQEWTKERSVRERLLFLLGGCFVIYFFWFFIFSRPILLKKEALNNQIITLRHEIAGLQYQANAILKIGMMQSNNEILVLHRNLQNQARSMEKTIETSVITLTSEKNSEKVLKDILARPYQGISLIDLKSEGDEPLRLSGKNAMSFLSAIENINKHKMQIIFRANYFNTMTFLAQLEKLLPHIYWDNMDYKVIQYPDAEVSVHFYILVNKMD